MAYRLRTFFLAAIVARATHGPVANIAAQSLRTEADVTVGTTTQDVSTAATQVRAFGDVRGWRFYSDASWAGRRGTESDAFGAAYPYDSKLSLIELKVEKTVITEQRVLGIRLGRYRTPFGIYSSSDQGYMGFLRAPLMRYGDYWALSNNYLETGASIIAGTPRLSVEASTGFATDNDEFSRPGGLNGVIRVQSAGGPLIVGVSYIETRPSRSRPFAKGRTEFAGTDVRWMKSGVQLRGEWIEGRPFLGTKTRGGYADVIVHRPAMGPVTAVARIERLDYLAGQFSEFPRRYTLGTRIRLPHGLTAQLNYIQQPPGLKPDSGHTSLDVALTYSVRSGRLLGRRGL